jgi:hypothetical protein
VASKRNSRKARKRMMMRAAAKAPNWVRDIAGSKSFRGPVVIRPDGTLIAGERRLVACKLQAWTLHG